MIIDDKVIFIDESITPEEFEGEGEEDGGRK